ncbi:MAG TPA: hypothetical protein VMK32_14115 [Burkholderiaceae bacterium]|nr:hypothetical protein [Burkholderiaceae bacterium]
MSATSSRAGSPHRSHRRARGWALALAAMGTAVGLGIAPSAHAIGSLVDVQVVDRSTGETLPMYWYNGRWWVPGKPGTRYAVTLTNRSGGRALTVVSVDGVNAVSGESASPDQTGYVIANGQYAQITGWRKDLDRVAAFEFTALADSYAARTGRPDNVGVIGVAVFRERPRAPSPPVPPLAKSERQEPARDAPAPAAGAAASNEADARQRSDGVREQRLGTGHGRNERSPTSYTDFERAQATPNELIAIHYDSRDNLIAMGVIPRPRPLPDPFPMPARFVPDPPMR